MLVEHLEKHVFNRDDIYFDETHIKNCISFIEKYYFKLNSFQKFLIAFIFLKYKEDDALFYEQFFIMMARGAGKNGLISGLSHYFISGLHGINHYNISVVATSEEQAKTSFEEIFNCIKENELDDVFDNRKAHITAYDTGSYIKYRTSNASTKDGLRDGCVIYDEVAAYENWDTVNVFSSGLGKVKHPREFFISTDGFVRDGFIDKMKERSMEILKGEELDDPMFPFICRLDDPKEVDDKEMWEKANPMFCEPRTEYAKGLFRKVLIQYKQLPNNPSNRPEFMTKRMNLPEVDLSLSIAQWEDILATNKRIPPLDHHTCVGGLDFADIRDFASVGLLFKEGDEYIWKSHSFVRKGFLENVRLKAPIHEWEEKGLLTILDEPVIDIHHIVDWFKEMREKYNLTVICADMYRLDIVKQQLEKEGFQFIYVRNPKSIQSILAPRVETLFSQHKVVYGDNPLMRWYTNNVQVTVKKDGNKIYEKKDEVRRKTDGFQAFIHALWIADTYLKDEEHFIMADIDF
ncbi:terminase large subunit [Staphylococcus sp. 11-B-312]|nr:terminase large subunit [Staphylococcus sp. 11-B-312]